MKTKLLATALIGVMLVLTVASCGAIEINSLLNTLATDSKTSTSNEAENNTNNGSNSENINFSAINTPPEDNVKKKDLDSSWDIMEATVIALNGTTATVSGEGANVSGGTITISQAGTYVVSGTLTKGQILIDVPKEDFVRLVLNSVDITADTNAAIYSASADKLLVILADGTTNKITDVSSYVYADNEKEEPDAALFCKNDLTINGNGTLVVNGNFKNGIATKDDLTIVSGNLEITAPHNGLRGKDSVTIVDGIFDITAGNDGIQTGDDEKKGWICICGGVFNIKAANDGIQAETDLYISGGTFDITTGGGSANAPVRSGGMGGGGMRPGGFGSSRQTVTTEEETESMKGLKAKNLILITEGEFYLDIYDDAVHSNNCLEIAGGKIEIKTGDDGIHADVNVLISGGDINIIQSYEGIEGLTITISGGNTTVVASDDGINASNGEGKALNGGRPMSGVNQDAYIRITGGKIDVQGSDGLDSNGHIYIEGGKLTVSGPSQTMEGAIDKDGDLIVTGGEVITAGSWDAAPKEATQPV
ncbi:MAG: carbohydrate-binding domain-containing protein, partial [Oscillospiraceae bacterium]|nr:carbohydrate-binding domain-containing protein [Oscillospiraceae bacterium]